MTNENRRADDAESDLCVFLNDRDAPLLAALVDINGHDAFDWLLRFGTANDARAVAARFAVDAAARSVAAAAAAADGERDVSGESVRRRRTRLRQYPATWQHDPFVAALSGCEPVSERASERVLFGLGSIVFSRSFAIVRRCVVDCVPFFAQLSSDTYAKALFLVQEGAAVSPHAMRLVVGIDSSDSPASMAAHAALVRLLLTRVTARVGAGEILALAASIRNAAVYLELFEHCDGALLPAADMAEIFKCRFRCFSSIHSLLRCSDERFKAASLYRCSENFLLTLLKCANARLRDARRRPTLARRQSNKSLGTDDNLFRNDEIEKRCVCVCLTWQHAIDACASRIVSQTRWLRRIHSCLSNG